MKILFSILFLSISIYVSGQTIINGGNVSGTWTLAGSPYQIQNSIMIPKDSTLSIEPGVAVSFRGQYKLLVLGRLLAIGTSTDTIIFTTNNPTNGWRGIRFDSTNATNDSSKILFCKIQYGIANGGAPDNLGGGLYFNNVSKVIVANSKIANCSALHGGGIYCNNSTPLIQSCSILNNITSGGTTGHGGGICITGNLTPDVINNLISNNTGDNAGGIYIDTDYGHPLISNNTIVNNFSPIIGGGIVCKNGGAEIYGNIISDNVCTSHSIYNGGGGIYCYTGIPHIMYNLITNNTALNGAGIYNFGGSPTISYNTIADNKGDQIVDPANFGGAGILSTQSGTKIKFNIISNNVSNLKGGGINCKNDHTIDGNIIVNNTSVKGGAIFFDGGIFSLTNNTIANNSATTGGGLFCQNTSSSTFNNCIIYGNTASSNGSQVYLYDEPSDPNFYYSNIQGTFSSFYLNGNFYTGTYSNNIDTVPLFVSPSVGSGFGYNGTIADWSLQANSICIDAGNSVGSYPNLDLDSNYRIEKLTNCIIDMGALEYQSGYSCLLGEKEIGNQIIRKIYPNPFSIQTTIRFDNYFLNHATLMVENCFGQTVLQINNLSGQTIVFRRDDLPSGLYFARIIEQKKIISINKIVITDN